MRNRLVLVVFGLFALVFLIGPFVVRWWAVSDICPAEITAKGRASGTDWEVAKSDCGPEVGTVWQVRIIPTKGVSSLAYDARGGGPEPVGYEQAGFDGTVLLKSAPVGETEPKVSVKLGPNGRPVAPVRFVNGKRAS